MKQRNKYFHGIEISYFGVLSGYVDYGTLAEAVSAELYDMYSYEARNVGYWELVNGNDTYYYDSDDNVYDLDTSIERIQELQEMIEYAEKGQDISKWEKDIDMLMYEGEKVTVYDYFEVSKKGARILMDESDELLFYNPELDTYVWGVSHGGMSYRQVLTNIPIHGQKEAA